MSAISLMEYAKSIRKKETFRSTIIELFAKNSPLLDAMGFQNIQGNAYAYDQEAKLPGVGFRGINEGFNSSYGVLNPQVEKLKIAGGDLDVDVANVKMFGEERRSREESMQIKALTLAIARIFLKGDDVNNVKEISGLQSRITGDQLISAGNGSGGSALSLAALDDLIDAVDEPTHLIMNKKMKNLLTQASRDTNVGGNVERTVDEFGRKITKYDDLPIIVMDKDNVNADILPFTEAAGAGAATATSIYAVSFTEDGVIGIQNGEIDARDLGEIDSKPVYRTRVEWLLSMAVQRGSAAARLRHIKNAAVVK